MMNTLKHRAFRRLIMTLLPALFLLTTPLQAMTYMDGRPVQIEQLTGQGKWTVFKVWASDCHVCRKTIHYLSDFSLQYDKAEIYGISIDGQDGKSEAQQFIETFDLDFPNLLTDAVEINDFLYAAAGETLLGTPTLLVYNPQGQLTAVQPGAVHPDDLIKFINKEEQGTTR